MPHLVLEYSENVGENLNDMLKELHLAVGHFEGVDLESVKSRSVGYRAFFVGDPEKGRAFIHVSVALLPGREDSVKLRLSKKLHEILLNRASRLPSSLHCSLTVELRELEEASYRKLNL